MSEKCSVIRSNYPKKLVKFISRDTCSEYALAENSERPRASSMLTSSSTAILAVNNLDATLAWHKRKKKREIKKILRTSPKIVFSVVKMTEKVSKWSKKYFQIKTFDECFGQKNKPNFESNCRLSITRDESFTLSLFMLNSNYSLLIKLPRPGDCERTLCFLV